MKWAPGLHSGLHGSSSFTSLAEEKAKRHTDTVETKDAVISFTFQLNLSAFSAVIPRYSPALVLLRQL